MKSNASTIPAWDAKNAQSSNLPINQTTHTTVYRQKTLSSISFDADSTVEVNGTLTLPQKVTAKYDEAGVEKTAQVIAIYTSGDASKATISGNTLTGVATGDVTITATYTEDGITETFEKTVTVVAQMVTYTITNMPSNWRNDDARQYVWVYSEGVAGQWVSAELTGGNLTFRTGLNFTKVKAVRMNPNASGIPDWNDDTVTDIVWNESNEMIMGGGTSANFSNFYAITGSFPAHWGTEGDKMEVYLFKNAGATDNDKEWITAEWDSEKRQINFQFDNSTKQYTTCIGVRCDSKGKPTSDKDHWNIKWNQTGNLTLPTKEQDCRVQATSFQ